MDATEVVKIGMYIFGGALAATLILQLLFCAIDRITGKTHLSCSFLGWHDGHGEGKKSFDGLSFHACCSKCGKEVMMDSQGNWF